MKTIAMIFLILFLGKGCSDENLTDMKNIQIQYEANTRGFYQKIVIKNQEISISKDRNEEGLGITKKISAEDWKAIVTLFSKIYLEKLETYEGPTQKRFHDGAAMANLVVNKNEVEYTSATFDHGTPPVEIAPFINKIVGLAKE